MSIDFQENKILESLQQPLEAVNDDLLALIGFLHEISQFYVCNYTMRKNLFVEGFC